MNSRDRAFVFAGGVVAILMIFAARVDAQVDVLTQHNDNQRTGANLHETQLKPAALKGRLHKLAYRLVDANVYAQPLIVTDIAVAGRSAPADIAIVATEHNSVYAFD